MNALFVYILVKFMNYYYFITIITLPTVWNNYFYFHLQFFRNVTE